MSKECDLKWKRFCVVEMKNNNQLRLDKVFIETVHHHCKKSILEGLMLKVYIEAKKRNHNRFIQYPNVQSNQDLSCFIKKKEMRKMFCPEFIHKLILLIALR